MSYEQFAYTYDRLMEDMPYPQWLRFLEQCWDKAGRPRTIVDLGCGTGNIAIPLAQSGMQVVGIDLSPDMLSVAAQKADALNNSIVASGGSLTLLEQDMRDWTWTEPVDAAISLCDCLNYILEEDDLIRVFRQTYLRLKQDGVFIFDVHSPSLLQQYAREQPFVLDEEDISYIWMCELDEERMVIEHDLTIFTATNFSEGSDGTKLETGQALYRKFHETHRQRAYPIDHIKVWLEKAGFSRIECCADFSWASPSEDSDRVFFIAWK